jgi:FkbM family methyltransferase
MKEVVSNGFQKLSRDGFSETLSAVADYCRWKIAAKIQFIYLARTDEIYKEDDVWIYKNAINDSELSFLHPSDCTRGRKENRDRMKEYYFDSEFAPLEEGDIVFDVGAYIGITSIVASDRAKMVYAIEPSPRARKCLEYNTRNYDNIKVLPFAAWDKSELIELRHGLKSSEDSLITPDDDGNNQTVPVQAHSIATIADIVDVDQIDFLKIEAEGVEPEIVDGIVDAAVKKVSSTGNAERYGETTYQEVSNKLKRHGYEVRTIPNHIYKMVYAKKNAHMLSGSEFHKARRNSLPTNC